jgi:hypothetical protein
VEWTIVVGQLGSLKQNKRNTIKTEKEYLLTGIMNTQGLNTIFIIDLHG